MTTTEQARELAERLDALHSGLRFAVVVEAVSALRELADQVERLEGQKWDVRHTDTANTAVQLGLARDAAEAEVAALTKERDALREAAIKVAVSASELNLALDGNEAMRPLRLAVLDASTELLAALNAGGER